MSINPTLTYDLSSNEKKKNALFPYPLPDEIFILRRDKITFGLTNSTQKFSAKGRAFLTSLRLVFVRKDPEEKNKNFTSIDLPFKLMKGIGNNSTPSFEQPIFGANYMKGLIQSDITSQNPLKETSTWTLTFKNGNCHTFITAFFSLIKKAHSNTQGPNTNAQLLQQINMGQTAFFDPADPSVRYTTQPTPSSIPPYMNNDISNNAQNSNNIGAYQNNPINASNAMPQPNHYFDAAINQNAPSSNNSLAYPAFDPCPSGPNWVGQQAPPIGWNPQLPSENKFPASYPTSESIGMPLNQQQGALSYPPQNMPPYQPQNMPPYQPQNVPPYQPQNMPPYQPQNMPPYQQQNMPPYQQQNMPLYQPQNMPPYQPNNVPPYQPNNVPSYQPNNVPPYQPQNIHQLQHQGIPPYQQSGNTPF